MTKELRACPELFLLLNDKNGKEKIMAKPNFQFQKRQKELEKKKKNEEKLQRKRAKGQDQNEDNPDQPIPE